MLAETMPKFDPALPAAAPAAPTSPSDLVIRLPGVLVMSRRLPTPVEVMGQEELARYAMNKYLGPEDGFDRGFLNLVNLPQLWSKIPVLNLIGFPIYGSMTNEQRALKLYHEDVRRQERSDLNYMANFLKETGQPAQAEEIKHGVRMELLREPKKLPRTNSIPAADQQN